MPNIPHADADYNVVQNNGPGAAQVIPHAHFHVIPRYPFDYVPPPISTALSMGMAQSRSETGRTEDQRDGYEYTRREQRRKSGGEYTGFGTVKASVPEGMEATKILFGRGQRHYRDDEEAEGLVRVMRERVALEWDQEFGRADKGQVVKGLEREREVPMSAGAGGVGDSSSCWKL